MPDRISKDDYFFGIAEAVSRRATCPRLSVGAVLVRDGFVIATGYNGAPSGAFHCTEVGCEVEANHCVRVIHAEINALLQAARCGHPTEDAICYTTHEPCARCVIHMRQAGVSDFFYLNPYEGQPE